jgi:hypothetical protein
MQLHVQPNSLCGSSYVGNKKILKSNQLLVYVSNAKLNGNPFGSFGEEASTWMGPFQICHCPSRKPIDRLEKLIRPRARFIDFLAYETQMFVIQNIYLIQFHEVTQNALLSRVS